MQIKRYWAVAGVAAAFGMLASAAAGAADYPSKPITLIVPWKAGGTTETMSQVLSKALGRALGGTVIVRTKPGGGGAVGATHVAAAKPDGYTIMYTTLSSLTWNPLTKPAIKFKTDSFEWVAGVSEYQMALITKAGKPYKTLKELVAYSKKNPGINVADMGGISKAFIRFLSQKEDVNWTQIPTRGGGEMVPFLLGDKVDFAFSGGIHQKYGDKMIVLASFLSNRLPLAPGVPSIKEIYGISMPGNAVIAAPKGTPKAIVAKLEAAIKKSMDDPDFTKILKRIKFPKRFIPTAKLTTKVDEAVAGLKKVLAETKKK